jgi:hypothetical protein
MEDYDALVEKAKQLSERRSFLLAQQQSISKQMEETRASLVKEFGENYEELFNDSVNKIREWEDSHKLAGVDA